MDRFKSEMMVAFDVSTLPWAEIEAVSSRRVLLWARVGFGIYANRVVFLENIRPNPKKVRLVTRTVDATAIGERYWLT